MADVPSTPTSLHSQSSVVSSTSDDFEAKSNEDVANEMAADFTKFLTFSVAKEETKFNDSVEMMLTKLDEFFSLVDMIRADTTLCLSTTVPAIQEKCAEMELIFDKIDKLEDFVNIVRDCVNATEEKVTKAEADLGAVGGLVKKLTSFVSKKKSPAQSTSRGKRTEFVPVEVFSTKDFFDHSQDEEAQNPSSSSPQASLEASGESSSSKT